MAKLKKRADGRVAITKVIDGKRKYFYGATKAEANNKLAEYEAANANKIFNSDILYSEWLDTWLDAIKRTVRANTYANYKGVAIHHLSELGSYTLAELSTPLLREFINKKFDSGLSSRSVEYIFTLLKASLKLAVNDELILHNPMDKIAKPKKSTSRKPVALTMEQCKSLLNVLPTAELKRLFYIDMKTGLRRSEILGLKWQDIDYKAKTLTIEQTVIKVDSLAYIFNATKNENSKRSITIDDATIEALKKQRKFVLQQSIKNQKFIDNRLVFPGENGNPRYPDHITHIAKKYGTIAELPEGFSFHSLRHTHATLLLKAGVHYKIVQARLGHATFQQTMDTYSHVTAELDQSAADTMALIL